LEENRLFNNWKRALIVSLQLPNRSNSEVINSIKEISSLTYSLGGKVIGEIVQIRSHIDSTYFFGKGKIKEIKSTINSKLGDAILVDNQLSPKQIKNLEKILECEVLDRTQLILEIFAKNARTREAKLQIFLAQSQFLLPRLVGLWKHLDRERGGIGASRGTGEKQIEKDRQFLRNRISHLKMQLERVEKERNTQKQRRSNCLNVSLVGYTNAGKSTIMNALTNSNLLVKNHLFATLDSTTRLLEDSRPKVLLSDTVGFIDNLPHELIAAFRSTMSTIRDADLLLHIIDANQNVERHLQTSEKVLKDLDARAIPSLKVFNKIDMISNERLKLLEKLYPEAVFVSAIKKNYTEKVNENELIEKLRRKIIIFFNERMQTLRIRLDYENSQKLSSIYEWSKVEKIEFQEEGILMTLTTVPGNFDRLRHDLGEKFTELDQKINV
tara:strand:- start:892 stop:2211 length:1320 start_codon:yes stop_codon:yes gene_type:complete